MSHLRVWAGASTASPTCVCTVQRDAYVFKFCSSSSYPTYIYCVAASLHSFGIRC